MEKLAIDGGKPVMEKPFQKRIIFDEKEKKAALRVIEKTMEGGESIDLYGLGPEVEAYKKEFANYFGVKFAVAVSSGTAAIHSALGALRLEPGSEIITSPITDPGTVAPILFQCCIPVFADVDYETLNILPISIEKNITEKTKVIIPVHLAGNPADMNEIMRIAKKYKLIVIEDCAQAQGAKYKGKYVGSIGDLSTFSLMGSKHTTSGGQGGMVLTNNEEFYWNAKRFADRGKPFNTEKKTNIFLGLNYRMTELEAAIGRVQLKKLAGIVKKRQKIVEKLRKGFSNLSGFKLWKFIEDSEPNPWFLFIHYEKDKMRVDKETIVKALNAEGIPIGAHYVVPIYKQKWIADRNTFGKSSYPWSLPWVRKIDYRDSCPNAERAIADYMTLYIHEGWEKEEIENTISAFAKVEAYYLME